MSMDWERTPPPPQGDPQALLRAQPSRALAEFWAALTQSPNDFDFHVVLRRIESFFPSLPRFGQALRPAEEVVRLGQRPELAFSGSALTSFIPPADAQPARLDVAFFGLFGPQGPLPLHLTEYVRDRVRHLGDRTFAAFADLFHHRMLLLFHRAWAQAEPTASQDRPGDSRFAAYVASLIGIGSPALAERDAIPDRAKLQYAGWLSNGARHPDGLAAMLSDYFEVPAKIQEFLGEWLELSDADRMRLGGSAEESALGRTTVLGRRVYRADHKFRVRLGPLSIADFLRFLPGTPGLERLNALVRNYVGEELAFDVRLSLAAEEGTQVRLGGSHRLGWNASLGSGGRLADVIVDPTTLATHRTLPRA